MLYHFLTENYVPPISQSALFFYTYNSYCVYENTVTTADNTDFGMYTFTANNPATTGTSATYSYNIISNSSGTYILNPVQSGGALTAASSSYVAQGRYDDNVPGVFISSSYLDASDSGYSRWFFGAKNIITGHNVSQWQPLSSTNHYASAISPDGLKAAWFLGPNSQASGGPLAVANLATGNNIYSNASVIYNGVNDAIHFITNNRVLVTKTTSGRTLFDVYSLDSYPTITQIYSSVDMNVTGAGVGQIDFITLPNGDILLQNSLTSTTEYMYRRFSYSDGVGFTEIPITANVYGATGNNSINRRVYMKYSSVYNKVICFNNLGVVIYDIATNSITTTEMLQKYSIVYTYRTFIESQNLIMAFNCTFRGRTAGVSPGNRVFPLFFPNIF